MSLSVDHTHSLDKTKSVHPLHIRIKIVKVEDFILQFVENNLTNLRMFSGDSGVRRIISKG